MVFSMLHHFTNTCQVYSLSFSYLSFEAVFRVVNLGKKKKKLENRARKKLQAFTEKIIIDLLQISFHCFNDTDVGCAPPVF